MMRRTLVGVTVLAGLGLVALMATELVRPVYGQVAAPGRRPAGTQDPGDLVVLTQPMESGEQVILVDKRTRVMAVYHLGASSGRIQLKSVRHFRWDLLLDVFGETDLTPKDIRAQLEK